jgi:hypothetical protein
MAERLADGGLMLGDLYKSAVLAASPLFVRLAGQFL